MLGRLLKAEFKATRRIFLPMFALILLFSVILSISLTPLYSSQGIEAHGEGQQIFRGITILVYVIVVLGSMFTAALFLIQRFYKHLLGDEGYLMFTLPVPTWQHIAAKGLLACFWIILSLGIGFLSILIISQEFASLPQAFASLMDHIREVSQEIGIPSFLYILQMILVFLSSLISNLLIVYTAIAIGHLWSDHRIAGAIGGFLGLQIIINLLSNLVLGRLLGSSDIFLSSIGYYVEFVARMNTRVLVTGGFNLVLGAGLFALTNVILSRHLNLE